MCLSSRMYWACFKQVGWAFVPFLVAQNFGGTLERVPLRWSGVCFFSLYARAGLIALEQGLHTLSISCLYNTSAGVFFTLEQVYWRSSGYFGAQAGSSLSVKVLEGGNLRLSGFPFALELVCFAVVSWRSSGYPSRLSGSSFCAWRSSVLLSAQAGHTYIRYQLGLFRSLFHFHTLSLTF